jgi:hypothetical protein
MNLWYKWKKEKHSNRQEKSKYINEKNWNMIGIYW